MINCTVHKARLFFGKRKLKSIKGGVFLKDNKKQSTKSSIVNTPVPAVLVLPLSQYGKTVATPVVQINDHVLKGQVIAQVVEGNGVPIHAPTSGIVISIEKKKIIHPTDMNDTCIVIQSDGQDQWCQCHPICAYNTVPRSTLIQRIQNHGVVGLGGAGFPTAEKILRGGKIKTLIINGAECESYISADEIQMRERAANIVEGVAIIKYILGAQDCMIGIENTKYEAITAMEKAVEKRQDMKVITFVATYPSGDSKQLIRLLTGVEVPVGEVSVEYGFLVLNISTILAVFDSVCFGQAMISRVITLTGNALSNPMNVRALLGTSVTQLLGFAGLSDKQLYSVVVGGGMMGFILHNQEAPVVPTTNCLIATTKKECFKEQKPRPCIRCGYCAQVCPVALLPQQLYWHIQGDEYKQAVNHHLFDCIECGACTSVCPSRIPLVEYYRAAKANVRNKHEQLIKSQESQKRFEKKNNRLERDKLARVQRRQIGVKKVLIAKGGGASIDKSRNMRLSIVREQLLKVNKQLDLKSSSPEQRKALQIIVDSLKKQIKQLEDHVT